MTQKGAYEKLFKAINKQLEKHKIIVKKGAIVDASIIDSPLKPKGQTTFEIENDRSEDERSDEDKDNENNHHIEITKIQKGALIQKDDGLKNQEKLDLATKSMSLLMKKV